MLIEQLDQSLFLAIGAATRSNMFAIAMLTWVSALGDAGVRLVIVAVVTALLLALRRRGDALFLLAVVLVSALLCSFLKDLVGRPRPDLLPHLDHVSSASFPSGHGWNGLAVFGGIGWVIARGLAAGPRWTVLGGSLLLVLAIGVSRVALGVHWPSDVIAGWLGGALTLVGLHWLRNSLKRGLTPRNEGDEVPPL